MTHAQPPCPSTTRLYEAGKVIDQDFGPEQIPDKLREHPEAVLWLDLFIA